MSARTTIFRILLPLAILVLGGGLMLFMIKSRQAPPKQEQPHLGPLVGVVAARVVNATVAVHSTGTVTPSREIDLVPQVGGLVAEVSPGLVEGGFFAKGDLLLRIEDVDYRLTMEQAEAAVARAEVELTEMRNRAEIARDEWNRLYKGSREPSPLVLYEPQLKNARAALASARAKLSQAHINLERTSLHAPFDCMVRMEQVDQGQYVRAGQTLAVLTGTERAEIIVPLPVKELEWIDIPRGDAGSGSPAIVRFSLGERVLSWQGRVVRSLGQVDEQGRMVRAVVQVEDPYGLKGHQNENGFALRVGLFVDVVIQGARLNGVAAVPRAVLRQNDTVWTVAGQEGNATLHIQPVDVLRLERDRVLLSTGLAHGDLVVSDMISGVAEGMRIRPVLEGIDQ